MAGNMFGGFEGFQAGQQANMDELLIKQQRMKNQGTQQNLQAKQQMMQLLQKQGNAIKQAGSKAEQLDMVADIMIQTGNIEAAEKAVNQGSLLRTRASTVEKNLSTILKDHADIELTERKSDAESKRPALIEAQTNYYNRRAATLGKVGGVKSPSADLKGATDLIERDYNISPEEARISGRPIVERAVGLMRDNPALTKSEAVARAYHEARASGKFTRFGGKRANTIKAMPAPAGFPGIAPGTMIKPGTRIGNKIWIGGPFDKASSYEDPEERGEDIEDDRAIGEEAE